jgi:hypothetical protein
LAREGERGVGLITVLGRLSAKDVAARRQALAEARANERKAAPKGGDAMLATSAPKPAASNAPVVKTTRHAGRHEVEAVLVGPNGEEYVMPLTVDTGAQELMLPTSLI